MTARILVGRVTDRTPESLEYGPYRGYVAVDSDTGEWLRNVGTEERQGMNLGAAIYSEEYDDLRPVESTSTTD